MLSSAPVGSAAWTNHIRRCPSDRPVSTDPRLRVGSPDRQAAFGELAPHQLQSALDRVARRISAMSVTRAFPLLCRVSRFAMSSAPVTPPRMVASGTDRPVALLSLLRRSSASSESTPRSSSDVVEIESPRRRASAPQPVRRMTPCRVVGVAATFGVPVGGRIRCAVWLPRNVRSRSGSAVNTSGSAA